MCSLRLLRGGGVCASRAHGAPGGTADRWPVCHMPRPAALPGALMASKKWLNPRLKEAAGGQAGRHPDSSGSKDNACRPACSRTFCCFPDAALRAPVLSPRHLLQLGPPGCPCRVTQSISPGSTLMSGVWTGVGSESCPQRSGRRRQGPGALTQLGRTWWVRVAPIQGVPQTLEHHCWGQSRGAMPGAPPCSPPRALEASCTRGLRPVAAAPGGWVREWGPQGELTKHPAGSPPGLHLTEGGHLTPAGLCRDLQQNVQRESLLLCGFPAFYPCSGDYGSPRVTGRHLAPHGPRPGSRPG